MSRPGIDLWSNDHIRADPHYTQADADGLNAGTQQTDSARARQVEENVKIIDTADIGEVFMKNMWQWRANTTAEGGKPGIVPLKMSTVDGIELLAKSGIVPEAVYVDASHHYEDVIQELTLCLKYWPDAQICGDDWDYPPVARAAKEAAAKHRLRIHDEGGKCWTYSRIHREDLRRARDIYYDSDVSREAKSRYKKVEAALKAGDLEQQQLLGLIVLAPPQKQAEGEEDGEKQPAAAAAAAAGGSAEVEAIVNSLYPPKGRTMLMLASIHGRVQAASALLALGAFVDMQTKQKRETALHLAAYHGHAEVCTVLLEAKCNIELVNEYEETAHQSAAAAKQAGCAALIAAAGEERKQRGDEA